MYQWYISTYVESYVELVANSSTMKPQCTGLVHAIIVNPDSCAVIRSSCLVKTTESNYLAPSY
jgi:hypothetical protein